MENKSGLDKQIAEIIRGYETVGHLENGVEVANGYDLEKDSRTEFGFYWEYEDMAECAKEIADICSQAVHEALAKRDKELAEKIEKVRWDNVENERHFTKKLVKLLEEDTDWGINCDLRNRFAARVEVLEEVIDLIKESALDHLEEGR